MPQFTTHLKSKREVARNTMEFDFERPEGFEYLPGQFMNWIYVNQPLKDKKGDRRSMSFSSSPTEPDLKIAMRISDSAYKQSLIKAPMGTEFTIIGPAGKFVLPKASGTEYVFLAGGIGITPFRSMIKNAVDTHQSYPITLIYSNYSRADSSYYDELAGWAKEDPMFRFIPTMTGGEKVESDWTGERSMIDETLLRKYVPDVMKPIYMIVGPPAMVDAMVALLQKLSLPKEQIIIEKFTGL